MAGHHSPQDRASAGGSPPERAGLRPEDHVLLARVEAELALESALGPTLLSGLPTRAAGAVELVRRRPGGEAAVADALAGRPAALRALLLPPSPERLPAPLVHHAAALHEHALDRAPSHDETRVALEGMIASWLELGREGSHLRQLATVAAAPTLDQSTRDRITSELSLRGIDRAERLAQGALRARSDQGRAAVLCLRGVPGWVERLGLPPELAKRATERAGLALESLVSSWLAGFRETLDDLLARDWKTDEAAATMSEAAASWEWLGREPELERHVAITVPDLAWPLYRQRAMGDVARLLGPIMPLAWALEGRILASREAGSLDRDLAYVAPGAQLLVFWAECTRDVEEGLARIERAYILCPTLRNARIVLAHFLCDRAEHTLARRAVFPDHPARADVERAIAVFPELSRLPALKPRVGIPE